jgi:hypothetical protein
MATAATAASETTTGLGTLVVAEARTAVARGWAAAFAGRRSPYRCHRPP